MSYVALHFEKTIWAKVTQVLIVYVDVRKEIYSFLKSKSEPVLTGNGTTLVLQPDRLISS